jgi:transposase
LPIFAAMPKMIELLLNAEERKALEKGYRTGHCNGFRQRCRIILLKADGLVTREIVPYVGIVNQRQINKWIRRYQTGGIKALENVPGQGRKPILDIDQHKEIVKNAVKEERQRLSQAKRIIEEQTGKEFDLKTLKRFLKNLTADTNAYDFT